MDTTDASDLDVDTDRLVEVLEGYPIRCALLYGSRVRGTATADSDVDVAVGFEGDLDASERLSLRVDLTVDLIEALGTDAVDVADLDAIEPAVGASALESGVVLYGDEETIDAYRERFEREVAGTRGTHEERLREFDAVLDRLEALL